MEIYFSSAFLRSQKFRKIIFEKKWKTMNGFSFFSEKHFFETVVEKPFLVFALGMGFLNANMSE